MATLATSELQLEGNTIPPANTHKARAWFYTLNNYTEEEYQKILDYSQKPKRKYIIGKEVGENGTPHLQGYIRLHGAVAFTTIKNLMPRAHIEEAKGNDKQNLIYCSKDKNFVTNIEDFEKDISSQERIMKRLLDKYENVVWRPWQKKVIDILEGPRNSRTINWVYDPKGNSGKSFLTKYIALTKDCVIADGKKENVFNQLNEICNEQNTEVSVVILDIPRYCQQEYTLNYGMLEALKDGVIYSGKYKGGKVFLDEPHVIVFSNSEPEYERFTPDRWNVINIVNDTIDHH